MSEKGKYLYCIIGENKEKNFGYTGINNREIRLIPYKDIAAVVSSTPIINFDRLDKKKLTTYIAIHQKVNEEVMKNYDVVPMTFGVIAPNLDEVMRILEKAYLQFKTALKNVIGKAEFVVQVWWNPQKILEELANTNLEIQKLKQGLSSKRTILGMPIKLKLGKLIAQKMEQKRQTFVNDVQASFGNLSPDFTSNKLLNDNMIVNLSLLIEKTKEPALDKKMQELGKKYEGKLRFKYIGPMPSYSFVNINLGLGNFELVNEARKLLGLGEEATFDEIKKAYYELAHKYHPDKFQGGEEQMKKLAQASRILENYCQSYDEISGKGKIQSFDKLRIDHERSRMGQKYSFKEKDVKNSIMIKYA